MNRMAANRYTCIFQPLRGALLAGVLCASSLWPASASATEFNIMKPGPVRTRHIVTAATAYGISMTLFAAGVRPEYAAPIGLVGTTGLERAVNNANEGQSAGGLEMIGSGALFSYVVEKVIQHPLGWRW